VAERVAIVGSRNWKDHIAVCDAVRRLKAGTVVVTGGARGVDTMAEQEALEIGLTAVVVKPSWVLGRHAGIKRNQIIVDISNRGIAFWDGQSPGTADTIEKFRRAGKPIEVIERQGDKNGK